MNSNMPPWFEIAESLRPHVVQISTPRGSGTGFLLAQGRNAGLGAIATAAHVIEHSHYWEEPIRVTHVESGDSVLLRARERAVFIQEHDTAAIGVSAADLPSLPVETLPLIGESNILRVGNQIGWLGFPAIPGADLCFFTGYVSAWLSGERAYLVDGVAINGVSGGPAFYQSPEGATLMGVVSAYAPNRVTGETLPGLSIVRDVTALQGVIGSLSSFDEAKAKETPAASVEPWSDPEREDMSKRD